MSKHVRVTIALSCLNLDSLCVLCLALGAAFAVYVSWIALAERPPGRHSYSVGTRMHPAPHIFLKKYLN